MRRRRNVMTTLVLAAAVVLLAAGVAVASEPGASPAAVAEPAPAATPALTIVAAPDAVTAGEASTLTVRLPDVPGATLQLSRKVAGAAGFRSVGPLVTSARGVATYRVVPGTTTTYRVEYAGDGVQWLPTSAEVVVSVRPRVTFFATARVYRGDRARLSVAVRPAHPGATVLLQQWKDGAWAEWRSARLDADSRAQLTWRTDRVGTWPLRVVMPADDAHLEGRSRVRKVIAVQPNPYDVPVEAKGSHRRRHLAVQAALLLLRPRAALVPVRHGEALAAHAAGPLQGVRQGHVARRAVRRADHVLPSAVRHPRHQRAVAAQPLPAQLLPRLHEARERQRHLALRPRAARHAGLERALTAQAPACFPALAPRDARRRGGAVSSVGGREPSMVPCEGSPSKAHTPRRHTSAPAISAGADDRAATAGTKRGRGARGALPALCRTGLRPAGRPALPGARVRRPSVPSSAPSGLRCRGRPSRHGAVLRRRSWLRSLRCPRLRACRLSRPASRRRLPWRRSRPPACRRSRPAGPGSRA